MAKTYPVDLSLNNPRTLRLKRDAALKTKDIYLAAAYDLRLVMLHNDAAIKNIKGHKQRRKYHEFAIKSLTHPHPTKTFRTPDYRS